jgi:hypothetical protein
LTGTLERRTEETNQQPIATKQGSNGTACWNYLLKKIMNVMRIKINLLI